MALNASERNSRRHLPILCALLLLCGGPSYGQLLLLPGQSWSYQFSTLSYTGLVSTFTANPQGSLQFAVNGSSWQPGSVLHYEMFENSTAETPIASGTLSSTPPFSGSAQSLGSWQDRQGALRFTMTAGSAVVDSITLQAIVPGPSLSSYNVYADTFVPVPEPAAPGTPTAVSPDRSPRCSRPTSRPSRRAPPHSVAARATGPAGSARCSMRSSPATPRSGCCPP